MPDGNDKGTQTPDVEVLLGAVEALTKEKTEAAYGTLSKVAGEFKTAHEALKKTQTAAAAKAAEDKAKADKEIEDFKKSDLKAPENSKLTSDRLTEIKNYALANGLTPKQTNDLVTFANQTIEVHDANRAAADQRNAEALKVEIAALNDKHPRLGGALKERSERLINALVDAKGTPELKAAMEKFPTANHPVFREFLLNIAEGMEPGTLKLGNSNESGATDAPWKTEFPKTAAAAKAAGVPA